MVKQRFKGNENSEGHVCPYKILPKKKELKNPTKLHW